MGNILCSNTDQNALMIGFRRAGVNTIAYKIKSSDLERNFDKNPAFGSEYMESSDHATYYNDTCLKINYWIFSSPESKEIEKEMIRDIYKKRSENIKCLIILIDSNDREMLNSNKELLQRYLKNQNIPQNIPVLILANKQDLPNCESVENLTKIWKLNEIMGDRNWHIEGSCATTGDGLYEGLDWIVEQVKPKD